jgi:L-asparagine transporter-like permease
MAAVYMLSIGSLWTRTKAVSRWLSIVTYIVALTFLFFAGGLRWARFIFPAWVMLVSIYILILNYRHNRENEDNEPLTLDA